MNQKGIKLSKVYSLETALNYPEIYEKWNMKLPETSERLKYSERFIQRKRQSHK